MAANKRLLVIPANGPGGSPRHARVQYEVCAPDDSSKKEWRIFRICRNTQLAQQEAATLSQNGLNARVVIYRFPATA